jgi:hypothetical protein
MKTKQQLWLNLPTHFDLEVTEDFLDDRLDGEVRTLHAQTAEPRDGTFLSTPLGGKNTRKIISQAPRSGHG